MKKLLILVFLVALAATSFSQMRRNVVYTPDTVVVDNVEIRYSDPLVISGTYQYVALQALAEDIGTGDPDGTIIAQASLDGTSYVNLNEGADYIYFFPDNDTLTITDDAVFMVTVKEAPFKYYRFKVTGTDADSTKITSKYLFK